MYINMVQMPLVATSGSTERVGKMLKYLEQSFQIANSVVKEC